MWDFLGKVVAMIWPGLSPQTQRRIGMIVAVIGLFAFVGPAFLPWASIYRDIFPLPAAAPIAASNNSGGQNGAVTNNGPVYNGPVTMPPPSNSVPSPKTTALSPAAPPVTLLDTGKGSHITVKSIASDEPIQLLKAGENTTAKFGPVMFGAHAIEAMADAHFKVIKQKIEHRAGGIDAAFITFRVTSSRTVNLDILLSSPSEKGKILSPPRRDDVVHLSETFIQIFNAQGEYTLMITRPASIQGQPWFSYRF